MTVQKWLVYFPPTSTPAEPSNLMHTRPKSGFSKKPLENPDYTPRDAHGLEQASLTEIFKVECDKRTQSMGKLRFGTSSDTTIKMILRLKAILMSNLPL